MDTPVLVSGNIISVINAADDMFVVSVNSPHLHCPLNQAPRALRTASSCWKVGNLRRRWRVGD